MKKLQYILLAMLMSTIVLTGCNNNQNANEKNGNNDKLTDNNNSSSDKKDKTVYNNNQNANEKNRNNDKLTDNNSSSDKKMTTSETKILSNIKNSANEGKVINSGFRLGDTIGTVIDSLGEPSERKYVKSAKGDYFTFSKNNIVIGCNKGEEIFEVRSFDKELNTVTFDDVQSFFGKPDYKTNTKFNEKIIGYQINKKFKILFVFDDKSLNLKHYSVLYPKLTSNSMLGDLGREW